MSEIFYVVDSDFDFTNSTISDHDFEDYLDFEIATQILTKYAIPITVIVGLICNLLIVRNILVIGDLTSGTLYMVLVGVMNIASLLNNGVMIG